MTELSPRRGKYITTLTPSAVRERAITSGKFHSQSGIELRARRCPKCRHRVLMPCHLCYIRAIKGAP